MTKIITEENKKVRDEWCVLIGMPVDETDMQNNRSHLRSLMFNAEKKMIEFGVALVTIAKILLPIEKILDNTEFWKDKKQGLVLFLTRDSFNWHSCSTALRRFAVVRNRSHLNTAKS